MISNELIDDNGQKVAKFTSRVQNLSRVAELNDAVIDIALSGAWRDYKFATGREQWREAEFDYFLIANDLRYEDAQNILRYNKHSYEVHPLMDHTAGPEQRRSFAEAAASWNRLNLNLVERAKELGWITDTGKLRKPPVGDRSRTKAQHGVSKDQLAAKNREERLTAKRRKELDKLAKQLRLELTVDERKYLAERLKNDSAGRPIKGEDELARWRADVERIGRKPTELARHWGVTRTAAYKRLERISA
jgi:hypothetical protein